jgi:hypothetical protein
MSSIEPSNFESGNFFIRLFYIVVYMLILSIVRFVLWAVLLVQLFLHVIGAEPSQRAQKIGQVVADYVYRIWLYLSYSTNSKPFPFNVKK